jgi:hypothetical protein
MGRSPLLTLGPSWPFTSVLLGIGGMIFTYFCLMLSMIEKKDNALIYLCYFTIALNVYCLFAGILKNPGIVQTIIDRKLKDQIGKGE